MAKFHLTTPTGEEYEIEAPDENQAVSALSQIIKPSGQPAASAALPAPANGDQGAGTSFVKGAALGLPFGDRFLAAGKTLGARFGSGDSFDYGQNLDRIRQEKADIAQQHPGAFLAGQVVGSAGVPFAAAGAASGLPTMAGRVGAGAFAGGAYGALQGLSDAPDWTNPTQTLKSVGLSGAMGAGLGGAVPMLARGIGAGYSSMADALNGGPVGISRKASPHLIAALNADGPSNVTGALDRLGPDAMLADAGPAFLGKAQGAALNSDEGRSALVDALARRNQGANQRIQGTVDEALGPAESPNIATQNILGHRENVDAMNYPNAYDNAPPVDISGVLANIGQKLDTAEGMQKKALLNLRNSLMEEVQQPKLNPDGSPMMAPGPSVRNTASSNNTGSAPLTLQDFIKKNGGLVDDGGDLRHMGLGHLINNKDGMTLDQARESAAEQGYLGANIDAAMSDTYIHDLLDALQNHPHYAVGDQEQLANYYAAKAAKEASRGQKSNGGWSPGEMQPVMETVLRPKTNVANLHNIRQEIDNVINYDAPGLGVPAGALQNQQAALKMVRGNLDEALKSQVPGFALADAQSAALAQRADAVKTGTSVFDSGKTAMTPEELSALYQNMEPGERAALAKGARGEIERQLDTKANDLVAGRNVIKGEGDWNRDRLATVFGQEPTDNIIGAIDREGKFRDTYNKVVENSQTAQRTAAARAMKPDPSSETPLFNPNSTLTGIGATLLKKGGNAVVDALMRTDPTAGYGEIARVLSAQGPQRDQYVSALVDALNRRGRNAATGQSVGNNAAIAAALAGDVGLRRQFVGQ